MRLRTLGAGRVPVYVWTSSRVPGGRGRGGAVLVGLDVGIDLHTAGWIASGLAVAVGAGGFFLGRRRRP